MRTPLMAFAAAKNQEMCKLLTGRYRCEVEHFDSFGCLAYHYALSVGAAPIQELLAKLGKTDYINTKAWQQATGDMLSYLADAVKCGCCAGVHRALQSGSHSHDAQELLCAEIGPFGSMALHMAVDTSRCGTDPPGQVCRVLLLARADPTARTQKLTPHCIWLRLAAIRLCMTAFSWLVLS